MQTSTRATLRAPILALLTLGCLAPSDPVAPSAAAEPAAVLAARSAGRPLKLGNPDLRLEWAVVAPLEQACGGGRVAGGSLVGTATLSHLGKSGVSVSAAWDLDRPVTDPQFEPVGPAGGPVATVLGRGEYPHVFRFDPFTGGCASTVAATGRVVLTAANGDQVWGEILGGETHRLDFVVPGDGVETFAITEIVGGTGRFRDATGAFVSHTVARFNPGTGRFDVLLGELLPGASIAY